jgi:hypothetical protein
MHKFLKWAIIGVVALFVLMLWRNGQISVAAGGNVGG